MTEPMAVTDLISLGMCLAFIVAMTWLLLRRWK